MLAVADRQSISGHGGEVMASPGSSDGASQLVVPGRERQDMISRFHDSLFAGHLGVSHFHDSLFAGLWMSVFRGRNRTCRTR